MNLTEYDEINSLLDELLLAMQGGLGNRLVGLYLYGSLVWGNFDIDISDIDLLAAVAEDIRGEEFLQLDRMQHSFVEGHKRWTERIEIAYIGLEALRAFKTRSSVIAIISPGEPFHIKEAGNDWLINLYMVREKGRTLVGPDPKALIVPISTEEFIEGVKRQALEWRTWIRHTKDSLPYQGYAILTMCRALYACVHGEQVSKKKAAEWVMKHYPQKTAKIKEALKWRHEYKNPLADPRSTYPETVEFTNSIIDEIISRCK